RRRVDVNPQPRLAEDDLVAVPEPDAAGAAGDVERAPFPHDPRSVDAPIVVQTEGSGCRLVADVRVTAGDALIDVAGSFRERDVVGPDQTIAAVANLRAASEIDVRGFEDV